MFWRKEDLLNASGSADNVVALWSKVLTLLRKATRGCFSALLTALEVGFSNWVFGLSSFSFFWDFVTHPGHASLRSLVDTVMAPLHACVGLAVESLALRRASSCATDIFAFIHEPRPVRTTLPG